MLFLPSVFCNATNLSQLHAQPVCILGFISLLLDVSYYKQGAKKVSFSTSPQKIVDQQNWLQFYLNFPRNFTCPLGKLSTEFTSPIENPLALGYQTLLSLHAVRPSPLFSLFTIVQLAQIFGIFKKTVMK